MLLFEVSVLLQKKASSRAYAVWVVVALIPLCSSLYADTWPQNKNGSTGPPSSIYVGDSNLTFHIDTYQWAGTGSDGDEDRSWVVLYTKTSASDIENGDAGPGRDPGTASEDTWANSAQITSTGTWYWAMRVSYSVGEDAWACRDSAGWTSMYADPDSTLSVTVSPLNNPSNITASGISTSEIEVTWSRGVSGSAKDTLVFRGTNSLAPTPTNTHSYTQGSTYSFGGYDYKAIYQDSGTNVTDSGLQVGGDYYYTLFATNNLYYSPGTNISEHLDLVDVTWDGDGPGGSWTNGSNWSTDFKPDPGNTTILRFTGGTQTLTTNDFTAGSDFKDLIFSNTTASFTLDGNGIDWFGVISNSSAHAHTISLDYLSVSNGAAGIYLHSNDLSFTSGVISNNGSDVQVYGANGHTLTLGAGITGGGKLTVEEDSTLLITAAQSYTGDTEIDAGAVHLGEGGSFGTTSITLGNQSGVGASLLVADADGGTTNTRPVTVSSSSGAALRTVGGSNTGGTNVYSGVISLSGPVELIAASGGTVEFDAAINNDQAIVKTGAGTVEIGSAVGSTDITVSNGTFRSGAADLVPNGATVTVASGGTWDLGGNAEKIESIAGSGSITNIGTDLEVGDNNASSSFSGEIGGSGTLDKIGIGTLTLSGVSSYSGGTAITAGKLILTNSAVAGSGTITIGSDSVTDVNAELQLNVPSGGRTVANDIDIGNTTTGDRALASVNSSGINTLSGDITLAEDDDGFRIYQVPGGTVRLTGDISGDGFVYQADNGGGTFELSGNNSYADGLHLDGGTVILGHTNAAGTGPILAGKPSAATYATTVIVTNGTFDVTNAVTIRDLSGKGIYMGNAGTGDITYSGPWTVNRDFDLFNRGSGTLTVSGPMDLQAQSHTLWVTGSEDVVVSGQISNGGVTKNGAGTLLLSGANTYDGDTLIQQGTLRLGVSDDRIDDDSLVNVADGATFDLNDRFDTIKGLIGSGSVALGSGTGDRLQVSNSTDRTFSGVISGGGNIIKEGSNVWTLEGTNTYTGSTKVEAGTLRVNGEIDTSSGVTVSSNATLSGDGNVPSITLNGEVDPGDGSSATDITTLTAEGVNLEAGGALRVDFGDMDGVEGTDWDLVDASAGTIANNVGGGADFTIELHDDNIANWNPYADQSRIMIKGAGVSGFDTNDFTVNTTDWPTFPGAFTIDTNGNDVVLEYEGVQPTYATWDGEGADDYMMTDTNWDYNVHPAEGSGTVLNFDGSTRTTPVNDYPANTDFGEIWFTNTAGSFTISGNAIDIADKIENLSANLQTISNNLVNIGSSKLELNPVGGDLTLNGSIDNSGQNIEVYGTSSHDLTLGGDVSGDGKLIIQEYSHVRIAGASTFTNNTEIDTGELWIDEGGSLSSETIYVGRGPESGNYAKLYVSDMDGGTTNTQNVVVNPGDTIDRRVIGGLNTSGENPFSGTLTLGDEAGVEAASGGVVTFTDVISGNYNLAKYGEGTVKLTAENTFGSSSILYIDVGSLELAPLSGTDPLGVQNIKLGTTSADDATLKLSGPQSFTVDSSQIEVRSSGGTKKIHGVEGTNTISSDVLLSAALTVQVDSNAVLVQSGAISGDQNLTKVEAGTLRLTGENTFGANNTLYLDEGTIDIAPSVATDPLDAKYLRMGWDGDTILKLSGSVNFTLDPDGGNIEVRSDGGTKTIQNVDASRTISSPITLNDDLTIDVAGGTVLTNSGVVSGDSGLTKDGGGTLELSDANTYNGDTVVTNGTLRIMADNRLDDDTLVNVSSNGTFDLDDNYDKIKGLAGSGSVTLGAGTGDRLRVGGDGVDRTFSGVISGGGNIIKEGIGVWTLDGSNTYSGETKIEVGTLELLHTNAAGASAVYVGAESDNGQSAALRVGAGLTVTNAVTARPTSGNIATISTGTNSGDVMLSGSLKLTKDAAGGGATPSTHLVNNLSSGSLVIDEIDLNSGGDENRIIYVDGDVTLRGVTNPPSGLHHGLVMRLVVGATNGVLRLEETLGANFYLDSGDVVWGTNFTLGASVTEFQVGTTDNSVEADEDCSVSFEHPGAYDVDMIVGFYDPTEGVTGTRELSFEHSTGTITLTGDVILTNEATGKELVLTTTEPVVFGATGTIDGEAGIRKQGTGLLTFSGAAEYEGDTYVDNGSLKLADFTELGSGLGTIYLGTNSNDAALYIGAGKTSDVPVIVQSGSGARTIGTDDTSGANAVYAANITLNKDAQFDAPGSMTVAFDSAGLISGAGGVTKVGTGTVTLSGDNTYSGKTTVNAGTLDISGTYNQSPSGEALLVETGATVNVQSGGSYTLGANSSWQTIRGTLDIESGGSYTENATWGMQVGHNGETGALNINGGTMTVQSTGSAAFKIGGDLSGSGVLTMNSGTLDVQTDDFQIPSHDGTGTVNLDGGTLIAKEIDQSSTGTGTFNFDGGTLQASENNVNFLENLNAANVKAGGAVIDTDGNDITIAQALLDGGGGGGLIKTGVGTLTLSGTSTYSGATIVSNGVLSLGSSGSIANSSLTTVKNDTKLIGTGTTGPLVIENGGTNAPGLSPGITTVSGNYTNNGALDIEIDNAFTGDPPTAGTHYDQVDVTGTVTLGATSTLNPIEYANGGGFDPDFGTVFTIINNDNTDTVTGTFSNYTNGETAITINGEVLKLFYNAGANLNDVVLVAVSGTASGDLYVNDQWTSANEAVDGNQETAATEDAYVGVDAFESTADAFTTHSGFSSNLVLNGGTYSAVDLTTGAGDVDLLLVGDLKSPEPSEANVTIGALTGAAGDTITLDSENSGNGNLSVSNGTFSGVIDGSGDLTKVGSGTLTLSGANTYSAGSTVDDGILQITGGTDSLPGSVVVNNPGVLELVDNDITWANTITGDGTVEVEFNNTGAWNTYLTGVGGFNGTVELTKSVATTGDKWVADNVSAPNVDVTINDGTTLLPVDSSTFNSITVTGTGNSENRGAIRMWTGSGTLAGDIALAGDTTVGLYAGTTISGDITSGASGTQTLTLGTADQPGGTTLSGAIGGGTGAIALTKAGGAGTATLSGANTYSGATDVDAGTLSLGSGGSISNSSLTTVKSGAKLTGTGTTGPLLIEDGGTNAPGLSPGITTVTGNYTNNGTLEIEIDDSFTGNSPTAGTHYDQVDVTNGTVNLTNTTSVLNVVDYGGSNTFAPTIGTAFVIINNDGADAVIGTFTNMAQGAVAGSVDGLDLKIYYDGGDGNDVVLVAVDGAAPGDLYVNDQWATADAAVDGNQETAAVEDAYEGVDAFKSSADLFTTYNSYTGTVTLNGGTYSAVDLTTSAGDVDLLLVGDLESPGPSETNVTIGTLTGAAADTITLDSENSGNGNLSVSNGTFSGVLDGSGDLTKVGSGTLTLSGANTYSGGTDILGGTLEFQNNDALGTARVDLGGGGVLQFGVDALDLSEDVRAQNDAGNRIIRLDLDGTRTGTLSGTLDIRHNDPGEFDIDVGADDTLTVSATIVTGDGGGAGLTKEGAGTLIIDRSSSYTGATTINGGTLRIAGGGGEWGPGLFYINSASTLELASQLTLRAGQDDITFDSGGGGSMELSSQQLGRNIVITTSGGLQNTVSGYNFNNQSAGRTVTYNVADGTDAIDLLVSTANDNTGIVKNDAGTLTLTSAANDIGGTITINGGTLEIGGAGRIDAPSSGAIINDGLFRYNSTYDQTLSGAISGTGDLVKTNTSTLTLTGASTYSGDTVISDGILVYNGTNTATTVTNASGGVLKGTGKIGTYIGPGTIAPGLSPGKLSVTNLVLSPGGLYNWDITNANSTAGIGWDLISVDNPGTGDGTVQIDATNGNPYTIEMDSTGLSDADFDNTSDYTWTIIDAGTVNGGFATNKFTLDTSGFTNDLGSGELYLAELDGDIVIRFSSSTNATYRWDGGGGTANDTEREWGYGGTGNERNWTADTAPASTNTAYINGGHTAVVSSVTSGTALALYVGGYPDGGESAIGTVEQTGGTLTVSTNLYLSYAVSGDGTYRLSSGSLVVSNRLFAGDLGSGTLDVSGGSIDVGDILFVGNSANSAGSVVITGGLVNVGGQTRIGVLANGTGTVTVAAGTLNSDSTIQLGHAGVGSMVVSGSGVVTGSLINVGREGTGLLSMTGGSVESLGDLNLGSRDGGTGTVTLYGGTIDVAGNVAVSEDVNAQATFTVTNGTLTADGDLLLGNTNGTGSSVFHVVGANPTITIGSSCTNQSNAAELKYTFVETNAISAITVSNNIALSGLGTLTITNPVGGLADGVYTLMESVNGTVDGVFAATNFLETTLSNQVAAGTAQILYINNAAASDYRVVLSVQSAGSTFEWDAGGGTANDAERDWSFNLNWTAETEPYACSNAWVNGGYTAVVAQAGEVAGTLYVGSTNAPTAALAAVPTGTVVQTGGDLALCTGLVLGETTNSLGTYNISAGQLAGGAITLGDEAGSHGILNVTGGVVSNDGSFIIGSYGLGELHISGVSTTAHYGTGQIYLGDQVGGTGIVTVSGGYLYSDEIIFAPMRGVGIVTQTAGTVESESGFYMGWVSGEGTYDLQGGTLSVGDQLQIGSAAGTTGTVTMTGGDLATTGGLTVGHSGVGALTMAGGTITVGGQLTVASASNSVGTVVMSNGTVTVGGEVNIGSSGDEGSWTMDGAGATLVANGAVMRLGFQACTGTFTHNSGTVTANVSVVEIGSFTGVPGTGTYTMVEGSLVVSGELRVGAWGGDGTMSVSGGSVETKGNLIVSHDSGPGLLFVSGAEQQITVGDENSEDFTVNDGGELRIDFTNGTDQTAFNPIVVKDDIILNDSGSTLSITNAGSLADGVYTLVTSEYGRVTGTFATTDFQDAGFEGHVEYIDNAELGDYRVVLIVGADAEITYEWDAEGGTGSDAERDWSYDFNWTGDSEPGIANNAYVNSNYTGVVANAGERVANLYVGSGSAPTTGGSPTGSVMQTGGELILATNLYLGDTAGSLGSYTLTAGELVTSNSVWVGNPLTHHKMSPKDP